MVTSRWTDELLGKASTQCDDPESHPNADDLAREAMGEKGGIRRHNHLLELADILMRSPSLALARGSELRRHLSEDFSPEAVEYFEPAPAPEWVDEAKLRIASELWEQNSVGAIAVLYALSLPCTYLYKNGVPALYATGKLAKREYMFQRIYETGLFVDDVLDEDGIQVLHDFVPDEAGLHLKVLQELDPSGDWKREEGGRLVRAAGKTAEESALEGRVADEVAKRRGRYIWGRGFLTARKVRFLHASIRLMLKHPELVRPEGRAAPEGEPTNLHQSYAQGHGGWDVEKSDEPINQLELAFGLLSFGYLIPLGLEFLGCRLSRERKEAFLHLWRVIGHVMGIREDLMTDDWDEARELLARVQETQLGHTAVGQELTEILMEFARAYMPHLSMGLRRRLPAHLIVDQLGRLDRSYPAMVLPADVLADTTRLVPRALFKGVLLWVRLYYVVRDRIVGKIPLVGETLLSALHRSSEELIESWRDQFRRRPFDIAGNMAWVHRRGTTEESERELQDWRRRVFNTLGIAILLLFVATTALVATGVAAILPGSLLQQVPRLQLLWGFGIGSVASGFVAWLLMAWRLPRLFAARPQ